MNSEKIRNFIDDVVSSQDVDDCSTYFDFVERCIDRVNLDEIYNMDLNEEAWSCIDDELIYYDDQWDLLRATFSDPRDANFDEAVMELQTCVVLVLEAIKEEMIEEKREELEEALTNVKNAIINLHNISMQIQDDLDTIKYDDCFDELADQDLFNQLEEMASDIEAFLSEYDVTCSCEEEINEPDEDFDLDLDDIKVED